MQRLLLMTAAALMILVAACSDVRSGVQAIANDGGEARVYLLSGDEVLRSSALRETRSKHDSESSCDASQSTPAFTPLNEAGTTRAQRCEAGTED